MHEAGYGLGRLGFREQAQKCNQRPHANKVRAESSASPDSHLHVGKLVRHNQTVRANHSSTGGVDSLLSVGG